MAERDGLQAISFPNRAQLVTEIVDNAMHGETALFESRRTLRQGMKAQLQQRIQQSKDELVGLQAELEAKEHEIALIGTELKGAHDLWQKNLMPISKFTALQREAVKLEGERGQLLANIAQTKGKISETELKILQIDQDLGTEVGKDLRDLEFRINELTERAVGAEDQLHHIEIRAPQEGVVHQLGVHTVGGVIGSGQEIMLIVPQNEPLAAELKIQPKDIDQVRVAQPVSLRFSAFAQSTTPYCEGDLERIAADLTADQRSGATFYLARVGLRQSTQRGPCDLKLLPGMPVEGFIRTGDRTVLSYFIKPLADQISRAFRDAN
jgi:HlyD family secretion protein